MYVFEVWRGQTAETDILFDDRGIVVKEKLLAWV